MTNANSVVSPAGIIFDFDGVVVDSLSVHIKSWQLAYEQVYQLPLVDTKDLAGRSTKAISEILAHRAGKASTSVTLADLKKDILRKNADTIAALPGFPDVFFWLAKHWLPFGIASNAPRSFITSTLGRLGMDVAITLGSDDVGRPKPEPDVFLKCAKLMQISVLDHARVIVFEDSTHGLTAAVRAGMFPIGVMTQHGPDELLRAGAKAVCHNVGEALSNGWFTALPVWDLGRTT